MARGALLSVYIVGALTLIHLGAHSELPASAAVPPVVRRDPRTPEAELRCRRVAAMEDTHRAPAPRRWTRDGRNFTRLLVLLLERASQAMLEYCCSYFTAYRYEHAGGDRGVSQTDTLN